MDEPRYQIVELIGCGGIICLSDDVMLDRKVAIKFVLSGIGKSASHEELLGAASFVVG